MAPGIQEDVSPDLVNDTPGIIEINGGNSQHFTIHRADVQANGTYKQSFTVNSIGGGLWRATAAVSCIGQGASGRRN